MATLRATRHNRKRHRLQMLLLFCLLMFSPLVKNGFGQSAGSEPTPEYAVKAVFLFNFTRFVEWPVEAFADTLAPVVIGVLGDDPFGTYLDETVRGEKVNGRLLTVKRYKSIEDIDTCHVLFISASEEGRIGRVLNRLKDKPALTVADGEGSAWEQIMIRFYKQSTKIRLRINVGAAEAVDLRISSKLLKLSEIASTGGK